MSIGWLRNKRLRDWREIAARPGRLGVLSFLLVWLVAACSGLPETPQPPVTLAVSEAPASLTPIPSTLSLVPSPSRTPTAVPSATLTTQPPPPTAIATPSPMVFAVIGDYGQAGPDSAAVAALVKSWEPEFIVTTGDNNYPSGAAETIDANIGQYYHDHIHPYAGDYGAGAAENRFFPVLGNHDVDTALGQPYLDYFELPGNERYYEFARGPVHFFALNSDSREPDGVAASSDQAAWLQGALAAAVEPWKIVIAHAPPYSSGLHGSRGWMRWPYQEWGASIVLSGHDHLYERLLVNDFPYIINGLGGFLRYRFNDPLPESVVRYNADYGALRVEATEGKLMFQFINVAGELVDSYTLKKGED